MDAIDLSEDVWSQLARIGAADVAVGLVTAGPGPALAGVAAAIKAGPRRAACPGNPRCSSRWTARRPTRRRRSSRSGSAACRRPRAARDRPRRGRRRARVERCGPHRPARGQAVQARAILMLSAEAPGTPPEWPAGLAEPVLKDGLRARPGHVQRNRYDGTLTQSLVIPFIWGLFGQQFRQPMADEFACSAEAASFFLAQDVWATDLGRQGLPFWLPLAAIDHGVVGRTGRARPPRGGRRAARRRRSARRWAAWRGRSSPSPSGSRASGSTGEAPSRCASSAPCPSRSAGGAVVDPERMQVGFRQGVRDLLPIWERILAPETLGDVLAVSEGDSGAAVLTDRLWARIVFDFLLAYRARRDVPDPSGAVARAALPRPRGRPRAADARAAGPQAVVEATERLGACSRRRSPTSRIAGDERASAAKVRRPILIERVRPAVDGGRFPGQARGGRPARGLRRHPEGGA